MSLAPLQQLPNLDPAHKRLSFAFLVLSKSSRRFSRFLSSPFERFALFTTALSMPPKGKKAAAKPKNDQPQKENEHDISSSEKEDSPKPEDKGGKGKKRGANKAEEPSSKKAKVEPVKDEKPLLKELDFHCEKTTPDGNKWNLKISTWNVAGIRAWVKKNGIDYIKKEDADIVCLQETKCSESKLPPEIKTLGYYTYWVMGEKEGYAGVGLLSKKKPVKVTYGLGKKDHDNEGRLITAEYEKFYLITTYVPNAGNGLKTLPKRLKWNSDFKDYVKELDTQKPVIVCGDMNVAHAEIDLANPARNTKNAGFTPEEREGMTEFLKDGYVDTFRHFYPEEKGAYTFWTYLSNARAKNTGWRLDYFIVSKRFLPSVCDNVIRNKVYGSDHCPVTLFVHV
ncbi:DNA-(apurinic or apyrimidinic site) lyase [Cimex lectularius]|uniref:DNA-(apurinic or apyrimidinic site) endonuclease n=1 Tax=Cimex lectularius TaxID=79782 RepID=A0A8I6RM68_CIMLE|nr:DNA-(apurinic or apyrimidinic site) lyase [Cimex lectularius]